MPSSYYEIPTSYEDAEEKLLSLRSNASFREQWIEDKLVGKEITVVKDTETVLERIGIPLSRLDQLSVVHVSGSKGKGSTCAMTESILRHHGCRTGFFSGPYLLEVRDMIRLDGKPIDKERFLAYTQRIYTLLNETQEEGSVEPGYFWVMVCMAFLVFLEEEVDVAIMEVGCGGELCNTNVLRNVSVVGIASLELHHTEFLGRTLAEVAAAKGAIMKRGCVAYTAPQKPEAMDVLNARAKQVECPLTVVPALAECVFPAGAPRLPADTAATRTNAALALQLAHAWLRAHRAPPLGDSELVARSAPAQTSAGLSSFRWPGRYQVVRAPRATYYVDFAHTARSHEICAQWFDDNADRAAEKILLFSYPNQKYKSVKNVLPFYKTIPFNKVVFVEEYEGMIEECVTLWKELQPESEIVSEKCLEDALPAIQEGPGRPAVLVLGSKILMRDVLNIFDPDCY